VPIVTEVRVLKQSIGVHRGDAKRRLLLTRCELLVELYVYIGYYHMLRPRLSVFHKQFSALLCLFSLTNFTTKECVFFIPRLCHVYVKHVLTYLMNMINM
jgi:hypothetical protein